MRERFLTGPRVALLVGVISIVPLAAGVLFVRQLMAKSFAWGPVHRATSRGDVDKLRAVIRSGRSIDVPSQFTTLRLLSLQDDPWVNLGAYAEYTVDGPAPLAGLDDQFWVAATDAKAAMGVLSSLPRSPAAGSMWGRPNIAGNNFRLFESVKNTAQTKYYALVTQEGSAVTVYAVCQGRSQDIARGVLGSCVSYYIHAPMPSQGSVYEVESP